MSDEHALLKSTEEYVQTARRMLADASRLLDIVRVRLVDEQTHAPTNRELCEQALELGVCVRFTYSNLDDNPEQRWISPSSIADSAAPSVLGWDFDRKAPRRFTVDLMSDVRLAPAPAAN